VASAENENAIEALTPQRTDKPLREGIGLRSLDRGEEDPGHKRRLSTPPSVVLISMRFNLDVKDLPKAKRLGLWRLVDVDLEALDP
jgi:hypothetical protein